jgi:adenylate cyclase
MPLRYRNAAAALVIALVASAVVSLPAFDGLRGLSIDVLTALRWYAFGRNHPVDSSPAVVVGLDEETYRTPPFAGTPIIAWTREIGRVLSEIVEGGAKVVGFDVVFPISIEQSNMPIGEETLGRRARGFDRDFLGALAAAARDGKLLLGEVQHSDNPVRPAPGQRIAVGHQRNIRLLNVHADADGVVRRVPLFFTVDGKPSPSMAVELASRAQSAEPRMETNGTASLAGYTIPMRVRNALTLNFEGGAGDVPTFSLVDLHACAAGGDKAFFRQHFNGKVVLLGTLMDVEDRILTSKRYATAPEGAATTRCTGSAAPTGGRFTRTSIAGVYVHATGVNNLIRRDAVRELGRAGSGMTFFVVSLMAAACGLLLAPVRAGLAFLGLAIVGVLGAVVAFRQAVALPLLDSGLAGSLALGATLAYRFTIADKDKRILRRSFALYLAPNVIETMLKSNRLPALGGEVRNVTAFFSDVAGFSRLSEQLSPSELVATMNEYLSAMSDLIEAEGGVIDKYIGDAIVAFFGAPVDDPLHARHAVTAALNCRRRLDELNRSSDRFKGREIRQRIGLCSGEALVGNIGSHRRFNYTVMGDVVNLASRLEGANRKFGTSIMASESTMALARCAFLWRELETIRVKGKDIPVTVYEPLAEAGQESPEQREMAVVYSDGLRHWRAREFEEAAKSFRKLASGDPPSALFLERLSECASRPPGPDWEPILALEEK